jgi:hypothetical protein
MIPSGYVTLTSVVDGLIERETGSLLHDVRSYYEESLISLTITVSSKQPCAGQPSTSNR